MPGIRSHVLNFFATEDLSYTTAWEWLQLACRPQLQMPDAVVQRCVNVIIEAKQAWPQDVGQGLNMQVAEQLYNSLVLRSSAIIARLERAKASAEKETADAIAAAKKQEAAAVAQYKTKVDELSADLRWLLLKMSRVVGGEGWGREVEDLQEMTANISRKTGIKIDLESDTNTGYYGGYGGYGGFRM